MKYYSLITYLFYLATQKILFTFKKLKINNYHFYILPNSINLICGNSFKEKCDMNLNGDFQKILTSSTDLNNVFLFYEISSNELFKIQYLLDSNFFNFTLVCHNGDSVKHFDLIEKFNSEKIRVYSVNYVNTKKNILPLPIGFPNKMTSINMKKYKKSSKKFNSLINFSIHTNRIIRKDILYRSIFYKKLTYLPWIPNKFYYQILSKFKFVISPPGNGFDCHRTWEALSLGVIPVILRNSLHPSLVCDHMLAVDDFESFFKMSSDERDEIYDKKITSKSRCHHYSKEYWMIKLYEN